MLQLLGSAVVPLCLVLIGLSLAYYGVQGSVRGALGVTLLKLLVLPALVLVVAHWGFGLSGLPLSVLVMLAALPVGSNALIFAQRYQTMQAEATAAIVFSTLAFVLTAPLWLAVLGARLAGLSARIFGTMRAPDEPDRHSCLHGPRGCAARAAATAMAAASTAAQERRAARPGARAARQRGGAAGRPMRKDLEAARAAGLAAPLLDRLKLTPQIIETVAEGCEQIAAMPDPVGEISELKRQPSGISVGRMRVPLGVFGMIYESRPNVTIEAASLAIKSGNACILRGGSEALQSNLALWQQVQAALVDAGLPADAVQLVATTDRAAVGRLIAMPEYVDVIIPRGGKSLIERISAEAKVPVIKHLDGNCHVYVDDAGRSGDGAARDRQRQDAEVQPLQCGRIAAGAPRRGGGIPAAHRRDLRRQGRADALRCRRRRRCSPPCRAPTWSMPPKPTGPRNTWRRSSASRWSTAWTRPSRTSTATARTTPTRS